MDYILGQGAFSSWDSVVAHRDSFIAAIDDRYESLDCLFDIDKNSPWEASLCDIISYIDIYLSSASYDGSRWNLVYKKGMGPSDRKQKAPDTLIDVESLSEDKRYLIEKIIPLSDDKVRSLRTIVDQVLVLRGD